LTAGADDDAGKIGAGAELELVEVAAVPPVLHGLVVEAPDVLFVALCEEYFGHPLTLEDVEVEVWLPWVFVHDELAFPTGVPEGCDVEFMP
jgi:hypothetical protein